MLRKTNLPRHIRFINMVQLGSVDVGARNTGEFPALRVGDESLSDRYQCQRLTASASVSFIGRHLHEAMDLDLLVLCYNQNAVWDALKCQHPDSLCRLNVVDGHRLGSLGACEAAKTREEQRRVRGEGANQVAIPSHEEQWHSN